jgi:drug/metabolite transporter (DMT)-like permease
MALLGGATMISFAAVFVKISDVPPSISAFYRMGFGGIGLLAIALFRRERLWNGWRTFGWQLLAALLFAGDLTLWHRSILLVGPGLATLLANFQVFLLTGVDLILRRGRVRPLRILSGPMALFGLWLIVGYDWSTLDNNAKLGIGLGLLTAVFYGSYILTLPKTQPARGKKSHFANMTVISLLVMGILLGGTAIEETSLLIPGLGSLVALVSYGILCQALGQLLLYKGRLLVEPSLVGLLLLLQPLLAYVWDLLFFAKETHPREVMGAGITLFAIWLGSRVPRMRPKEV